MATFFIILLAIIVLIALIHYTTKVESAFIDLGILAIGIVVIVTMLSIISINTPNKTITLKQPIQDSLKVENTIVNDSITKSDTTYIYTYIK